VQPLTKQAVFQGLEVRVQALAPLQELLQGDTDMTKA
jgi:hypothetical protein